MKQINGINVLAPGIFPEQRFDEAKVLGLMTWLWYQSPNRSNDSIDLMIRGTLPAIKANTFILFSNDKQLLGCCNYACFSAPIESLYCHGKLDFLYDPANWLSGDQLWIINWSAPFGHHWQFRQLMREHLFKNTVVRSLKVTRVPGQLKLLTHRGVGVSLTEQRKWETSHPILPYQPTNNPK